MKRCSTCKRDLPFTSFTKRSDSMDGYRMQCKPCVSRAVSQRVPSSKPSRRNGPTVPVGPFREWLTRRAEVHGGWNELALVTGLPDREIRRVVRESKRVTVSTVDQALVREGGTMLWELYPELYE